MSKKNDDISRGQRWRDAAHGGVTKAAVLACRLRLVARATEALPVRRVPEQRLRRLDQCCVTTVEREAQAVRDLVVDLSRLDGPLHRRAHDAQRLSKQESFTRLAPPVPVSALACAAALPVLLSRPGLRCRCVCLAIRAAANESTASRMTAGLGPCQRHQSGWSVSRAWPTAEPSSSERSTSSSPSS